MAIKVYIDQGHNPVNPNAGAEGNGYREQDLVYEIGVLTSDILRANGYEIKLSRPTPTTQLGTSVTTSLATRVNEANAWGADYFVSLHTNASVNPSANGAEVLVYRLGSAAADLAESVLEQLVLSTGVRARGVIARPGLYVLRKTQMPAILVEMGFITNPGDASLMANSPQLFAEGIADGIIDYVNRSIPASAIYVNENMQSEGDNAFSEENLTDGVSDRPENEKMPENVTGEGREAENKRPLEEQPGGETPREEGTREEMEFNNEFETYDDFIKENSKSGILKIQAFRGDQVLPVEGVEVRISKDIGDATYIFFEGSTNEDGIIDPIILPAPPVETSLSANLPDKTVIYRLDAYKDGYEPMTRSVEMFEGIKTIQPLQMIIANGGEYGASKNS